MSGHTVEEIRESFSFNYHLIFVVFLCVGGHSISTSPYETLVLTHLRIYLLRSRVCTSDRLLGEDLTYGDLLLSHPEPCQIRLHTLSTGETHPLARNPATLEYTRIVPGHTIVSSYSIRVSADYVGILFLYHDDENELVVWNWKTGAKCLVSIG
jgi:hypothetical protein